MALAPTNVTLGSGYTLVKTIGGGKKNCVKKDLARGETLACLLHDGLKTHLRHCLVSYLLVTSPMNKKGIVSHRLCRITDTCQGLLKGQRALASTDKIISIEQVL